MQHSPLPAGPVTEEVIVDDTVDDTFEGVRSVLGHVLGIEDRQREITPETGLLGELPELDSLSVVELVASLEDRFDILVEDEDFTGEVFETVGSLSRFVAERRRSGR